MARMMTPITIAAALGRRSRGRGGAHGGSRQVDGSAGGGAARRGGAPESAVWDSAGREPGALVVVEGGAAADGMAAGIACGCVSSSGSVIRLILDRPRSGREQRPGAAVSGDRGASH